MNHRHGRLASMTRNPGDGAGLRAAFPKPPPSAPPVEVQFAAIPAGTLTMRDARTNETRSATLRAFDIGTTQITLDQWSGTKHKSGPSGLVPAHAVTWFDAVRWCNNASTAEGLTPAYTLHGRNVAWDPGADGYRLPTEAEWEWASRAGTTGSTYGDLADIAWTGADHVHEPQAVALKQPNSFGLHDTIGNVWEWCWDYADTSRYGDYRSLRGGGWADKAWSCRASVRRGSAPDAVLEDVGFRVARGSVGSPGATAAQGWSAEVDRQRADIRGPLPVGWTPLRSLLHRVPDPDHA